MLSKTYSALIFLLASTTSVNAQAVVAPTLGVKRVPAVTDVQRPSIDVEPCGDVDIPQNLDICTATLANASGCHFPFIITSNLGVDGSRSIKTVQIDASGTGKNFVPAKIVADGDSAPANYATQLLTVPLPIGTKCIGGAGKEPLSCFGNCIVVQPAVENVHSDQSQSKTGPTTYIRRAAAENDEKDNGKGERGDKGKGGKG